MWKLYLIKMQVICNTDYYVYKESCQCCQSWSFWDAVSACSAWTARGVVSYSAMAPWLICSALVVWTILESVLHPVHLPVTDSRMPTPQDAHSRVLSSAARVAPSGRGEWCHIHRLSSSVSSLHFPESSAIITCTCSSLPSSSPSPVVFVIICVFKHSSHSFSWFGYCLSTRSLFRVCWIIYLLEY